MASSLFDSQIAKVLDRLNADAVNDSGRRPDGPTPSGEPSNPATPFERFARMKGMYMAIDPPYGHLMYSLIRATGARTVIEFGTSFGVSTIYLAAALRDNGAGKVITTEFFPEKADKARANLTEAGLADWVEFRVGDALQTLRQPLPGPIDFLFLDGDKSMYLDVMKLLEPSMKSGCLVSADNTEQEGAKPLLAYLSNPQNGYITTAVLTKGGTKDQTGHEIALRL